VVGDINTDHPLLSKALFYQIFGCAVHSFFFLFSPAVQVVAMKFNAVVALSLASLVTAAPPTAVISHLERRQMSANDLTKGACKGTTLIFARGTTEPGNIGTIVGGPFVSGLKKGLNNDLAVEGVNYAAGVGTNMGPGGADPKGVSEGTRLFNLAATKCPSTIIIGGGYSQGAAVMHGAAKALPPNIQARIAGIALFGDTQNKQSGGHIKGLPETKSKVFCIKGDGVCNGMLNVNGAHMSYPSNPIMKEAVDWMVGNVKAMKASGGKGGGAATEE